jgi:ribokinase
MSNIVVVGSANADLMVTVPTLPGPGQTIRGGDFIVVPGGKGANQAVAAARLGSSVHFVGAVGNDDFGQLLSATLVENGIETGHLTIFEQAATGVALIMNDARGENCIALAPGANDLVRPEMVDLARGEIQNAAMLICQLEVPLAAVEGAVAIAKQANVPVLLNPAPAQLLEDAFLSEIDFIIPNEHELGLIAGTTIKSTGDIEIAANALLARGARTVIVTLGEKGALRANESGCKLIPAPKVEVVDTTGAGDTFIGAFAAAFSRLPDVDSAIEFAQAAAAHSTTARGAQASMPYIGEFDVIGRRFQAG